jgi:dimethylhistidine N-methyltransferase
MATHYIPIPGEPIDEEFAAAVLTGLARPQKEIPARFFYDRRGSRLFEQITALPEYYPTRTEIDILQGCIGAIAARTVSDTVLVELGSGSSRKTELLLSAIPGLAAYVAIEISRSALKDAERRLQVTFPNLEVIPLVADFTVPIVLPEALARAPKLGFFPGSTIGNFTPDAARGLLETWRVLLGPQARLVIGVDLDKDTSRLIPAYDDREGVTAQFNLNLLWRINRELGANFDLTQFRHEARFNTDERRIEMHLVSRVAQVVTVLGERFVFAPGETIHTENSYKYSVPRFQELARRAGWVSRDVWLDPEALFSVHELSAVL